MFAAAEPGDRTVDVLPRGLRGRRVLIIQSMIRHYRQAFYEGLAATLDENDVTLRVAYSLPSGRMALSNDDVPLDPSIGVVVPMKSMMDGRLIYQDVWKHILWADLVIVEQANKFVINHPLMLASMLGIRRLGLWGHGWNHQLSQRSLSERLKRRAVRHCDWWFAYTENVGRYVAEKGMNRNRITVVENTVDTGELTQLVAQVSDADIAEFRRSTGIPEGSKLGVFSGALYERKRMPFLLEAAHHIKAKMPDFHLVVIGDGPDGALVKGAAARHDWIHALGTTFGRDKAVCYRLADVFLCPGMVGLAIVDALAAGLPFLTSDLPIHSPEIEYLDDGANGLYLPHDVAMFGDGVAALLADEPRLAKMKAAAQKSAAERPMSRMVSNFSDGILSCLGLARAVQIT